MGVRAPVGTNTPPKTVAQPHNKPKRLAWTFRSRELSASLVVEVMRWVVRTCHGPGAQNMSLMHGLQTLHFATRPILQYLLKLPDM